MSTKYIVNNVTGQTINGETFQRPYKVYTALLTQTGTDAPTAIVLENTIGNIIFSYHNSGEYYGILNNAFPINKTPELTYFTQIPAVDNLWCAIVNRIDDNTIRIQTRDTNGTNISDGILYNTFIEIRVYN